MKTTQEKKTQVRELRNKDIGTVIRLISKLELKEKLVKGVSYAELVFLVLEGYDKAENDLNAFLGELCGVSGEEYAEMEIDTIFTIFEELKKKPGKLANFLQSVTGLLKAKSLILSSAATEQEQPAS